MSRARHQRIASAVCPKTCHVLEGLCMPSSTTPKSRSTESVVPSFAELGLPDALIRALQKSGIDTPFPIQAATMPDALSRRDVLGRGRSTAT